MTDSHKLCKELNEELQRTKKELSAQRRRIKEIQLQHTDSIICPEIVINYVRDIASYISIWLYTPDLMRAVAQNLIEDNTTGPIRQEMETRSPRSWGIKNQVHWDLCVAIKHALQCSADALEEMESNDDE